MGKILIQANNLDMVIDVFMYIYQHQGCGKQEIADYCGFTLRQVDYYTNACKYLDLINNDWSPTNLAIDIFENNPAEVTERVYKRITEDEIIGQVYRRMIDYPDSNISDFAKEIVMEYYPGFSDAVYDRRSDNMVKWCKKIINYNNK